MSQVNRRGFLKHVTAGGAAVAGTHFAAQSSTAAPTAAHAAPAAQKFASNFNDPNLHLLVDDDDIAQMVDVERVVNRPRKHTEPVLVADRPWEGERAQAWGSVVQEPDGLLRIWYFAFNTQRRADELDRGGYAYAESRDGIHWEKPDLGLVEFRGSKKNNLFYTFAPDGKNLVDVELARRGVGLPALDQAGTQIGILNNADGLTVVRDDDDPDPRRRYKLIANMQDHRMWAPYDRTNYPRVTAEQVAQARDAWGQYLDTSPDGIHWTRRPRRMLPVQHGDYMMVTRDERNRRWWLNERAAGRGGRNAALRTSSDWVHWTDAAMIFDNGADSDFGRKFEWHGGITPFNYGRVNLGLLEKWCNTGFGNICELVSNRDGQPWKRVAPGTPFLDVGPEGAFDRVLAYPTHNGPFRLGDKLLIFYTGGGAKSDPNIGIPMSIGLATIGLDRFAGLASWRGRTGGLVVTKPLEVRTRRLQVNVESLEQIPLQAALSEPDGKMLPGYGFDDSNLQIRREAIYTDVRWRDKADVAELLGNRVALHLRLKGAIFYSYRFT